MGRRKKKLAIACELLIYGGIRKLGHKAIFYERYRSLPVEPDIVIPDKKVVFLVQHQIFTNQRYPLFNKVDQVLRVKFKSEILFDGEKIPGKDVRILGAFFGPMWAPYHLGLFDFFSDGTIECPVTKVYGNAKAAEMLSRLDEFARETIEIKQFLNISKSCRELDKYYSYFRQELKSLIPKEKIDVIIDLVASKLRAILRRPLNRNIDPMIDYEIRKKEQFGVVKTQFPVSLYGVFFKLILLGNKFRNLKKIYEAEISEENDINSIINEGVSIEDIKLLSELNITKRCTFTKIEGNNVNLTPPSFNLINCLKQMDPKSVKILEEMVSSFWSDSLVGKWLDDLHHPKKVLEVSRNINYETKDFKKTLHSLIDEKKWYGVEIVCKVLGINKEEIPQEITKLGISKSWPKRPTPEITNKPESLTPQRVNDIIKLFELKADGLQGLKRTLSKVDESFIPVFEDFRRKQLVGKLPRPQEILLERFLNSERIVFSYGVNSVLRNQTRELCKFITSKEKSYLPDRPIYSNVLLPPYSFVIPTDSSYDIYVWCKTDLTGSNEGFVRAKMTLSRYTYDSKKGQIVRNRVLPVLVTDFFFGGEKVLGKFKKAGIKVFQLNSVPVLEEFLKFIESFNPRKSS